MIPIVRNNSCSLGVVPVKIDAWPTAVYVGI